MTPRDRRRLQRSIRKILPNGWTATRVSERETQIRTGKGHEAEWSLSFSGIIVRPPYGKLGRILVTDKGVDDYGRPDKVRRVHLVGIGLPRRGIIGEGYKGHGWRASISMDVQDAVKKMIAHWKANR